MVNGKKRIEVALKKGSSNSDLDEIADQLADQFKSLVKDGDMADLEEVFDAIDDKGTGYISKKQFSDVIKEDLNMKISQKNFRLLMDEFDSNGNGKVEYSEFISFCKLHGYKVSRLKKESRLKSRLKNRSDNASDDEGNYVGSRRKLGNLGKKHQIQDIEEKLAQQFKDAVQGHTLSVFLEKHINVPLFLQIRIIICSDAFSQEQNHRRFCLLG